MTFDPLSLAIVFACLASGGILKGATGAGMGVVIIPALAMLFDVKVAVMVMLLPNLLTNVWQGWHYRQHLLPPSFVISLSLAGATGGVLGTMMLTSFSPRVLSLLLAGVIFLYVFLRLARPNWRILYQHAARMVIPAGLTAGLLQGAAGLSAPVSIGFLNAMRLERSQFIGTISILFIAMSLSQIGTLGALGFATVRMALISFAALVPILLFIPAGTAIARRLSAQAFDRAILLLLLALAVKMVIDAF